MYVLSNAKLENMRAARSASFVRIFDLADNILAARNRYLHKIDNARSSSIQFMECRNYAAI